MSAGNRRFDGLQVPGGLYGRRRRRVHGVCCGEVQDQCGERGVRELSGELLERGRERRRNRLYVQCGLHGPRRRPVRALRRGDVHGAGGV